MRHQTQQHIIFVHHGNPDYLYYTLLQAKKSNPEAIIHLIGDDSNDKYDFINHYNTRDYSKDADVFKRHYVHMATNPYEFILFASQRWFIIKEFMIAQNIDRCFHPDSDVLIYFDMAREYEKFKKYDFTVSTGVHGVLAASGHSGFWNSKKAIEDFCIYLMDIYIKKDMRNYDRMQAHYRDLQQRGKGGGATEMTALCLYKDDYPGKVGETTKIIDHSTYDNNINSNINGTDIYVMSNGLKKIEWHDGLPYAILNKSGERIRFNTLHCQGDSKKYIPRIYHHKKAIIFDMKKYTKLVSKNTLRKITPQIIWNASKKILAPTRRLHAYIQARSKIIREKDLLALRKRQNQIRKRNSILEKSDTIRNKIYLDCGAHIGEGLEQFMKMYAMDNSWTIYTFEPTQNLYEIVKSKFTQKNIHPIRSAVWTSDGTIDFYISSLSSASSILKDVADLGAATYRKRIVGGEKGWITDKNTEEYKKYKDENPPSVVTVPTIDFSNFLKKNFDRDDYIVVKLDIEGAEYKVLRKMIADGTLQYIDEIYIEFDERFMREESSATNQQLIDTCEKTGVIFHIWN